VVTNASNGFTARRIYQLDPEGIGALYAYLDRFWNRALAAFKTAVERPTEEFS
jgi:hypothetical protein